MKCGGDTGTIRCQQTSTECQLVNHWHSSNGSMGKETWGIYICQTRRDARKFRKTMRHSIIIGI